MESWGTPAFTGSCWERTTSNRMDMIRLLRKHEIHDMRADRTRRQTVLTADRCTKRGRRPEKCPARLSKFPCSYWMQPTMCKMTASRSLTERYEQNGYWRPFSKPWSQNGSKWSDSSFEISGSTEVRMMGWPTWKPSCWPQILSWNWWTLSFY